MRAYQNPTNTTNATPQIIHAITIAPFPTITEVTKRWLEGWCRDYRIPNWGKHSGTKASLYVFALAHYNGGAIA